MSNQRIQAVCPMCDSLLFVSCIDATPLAYGVLDCDSHLLYDSWRCPVPAEEDMKGLRHDSRNSQFVIKQKGSNRYAVFKHDYQLFDIIQAEGSTLQLIKRYVCHPSLLTAQDQYNLGRDLTHCFFPGFFLFSSRYIATLYVENTTASRPYLLVLDWEGTPLYRWKFPEHIKVNAIGGDIPGVFYAIGEDKEGRNKLYQMTCTW